MVQSNKPMSDPPNHRGSLVCIFSSTCDARIKKKFNYTTLAMGHYIYANKTNSKTISIHEFIDKLLVKYNLENIHEKEPLQTFGRREKMIYY